jgi:predicted nucleic acid-binding protein
VLYSARNPAEYTRTASLRAAGFVDLPPTPEIARRARETQAMLATRSRHRAAGCADILTAAIAEHYSAIVLHYDADFEHIAAVSGLQTRWVVPRGVVS